MIGLKQEEYFLSRPFIEEGETPLIAIVEFDPSMDEGDMKDSISEIGAEMTDRGIVYGRAVIDKRRDGMALFSLQKTNISYSEVEDINEAAMEADGSRDVVISTTTPDQIPRYSDR